MNWVGVSLGVIVLLVFVFSVRIVDQSKTCAIVRLGGVVGKSQAGFQLVAPFVTQLECYPSTAVIFQTGSEENKKADFWDYPVEIKTSDGQTGNISFNLLYSVDPKYVEFIRGNVAQDKKQLNERIVANFSRSIPRNIAAKYAADGLYATERAKYAGEVEEQLRIEFAKYGVILTAFELRDVQFSAEYESSIEQQQIAEEQIQTAQFVTEQKKQEAEQMRIAAQGRADSTVIEAEAEAKALAVVAKALKENPNIMQYEYIQKLADNISVMMIPEGQEFIYSLPRITP